MTSYKGIEESCSGREWQTKEYFAKPAGHYAENQSKFQITFPWFKSLMMFCFYGNMGSEEQKNETKK